MRLTGKMNQKLSNVKNKVNMKNRVSFLFILLFCCIASTSVKAQVAISGLVDFELRVGGEDSSPYINQTPNSNLSLYTPNVRLFFSSNLSEQWFMNAVLQSDHYKGEALSTPFFSLLNINWAPSFDSDFVATAGRFVTPYGSYSKRFLSNVNPFVHLPLSHAARFPVSNRFGHLKQGVTNPSEIKSLYGEGESGLNMIYPRMYSQGLKVSHSIGGDNKWLSFDVAATLAPASSHFDYGQHDQPSWVGRLVFHPVIWAELGVSYSQGTFLYEDEANDSLLVYDISSYEQILKGADLTFNYRYYTLLVEWNQSYWKAPLYDPDTSTSDARRTGKATADHISAEFIYDLPFLVGSYAAIRVEKMFEGEIDTYTRDSNNVKSNASTDPWVYDRQRFELAAGYKLQRNVLLKASYLLSDDDWPDYDDNVFTIQLSVLF